MAKDPRETELKNLVKDYIRNNHRMLFHGYSVRVILTHWKGDKPRKKCMLDDYVGEIADDLIRSFNPKTSSNWLKNLRQHVYGNDN